MRNELYHHLFLTYKLKIKKTPAKHNAVVPSPANDVRSIILMDYIALLYTLEMYSSLIKLQCFPNSNIVILAFR